MQFLKQIPNVFFITFFILICLLSSTVNARMVSQIIPTLTISEEYTDNFLKTENNTQEEFKTTVGAGFSIAFLEKKSKLHFAWNPHYIDYDKNDDRDRSEHKFTLDATLNPTKNTHLTGNLSYTTNDEENTGESWNNSATMSGSTKPSKNTKITFSQSFSQSFDQQLRTGDYSKHEVNKTSLGLTNQFGEKDSTGISFAYEFDDYENSNADEYTLYRPGAFLTYWFTPLNGIDTNLSYESKDLDSSSEDNETYSAHIRYLRKFTKHLNGYVKYKHSFSDDDSEEHTIYHPSLGIDWQVTDDSGVSIGVGVLFHEWKNSANDDSEELFFDLNAYKNIDFGSRGKLAFTASSGYSDSGEDAASLGYTTNYDAGFKLSYMLHKRLTSDLNGSYSLDDFNEVGSERMDTRLNLGCGLNWTALRWLRLKLNYSYTDYDTDSSSRDDYKENRVILTASITPEKPLRPKTIESKDQLDNELFD